MIRIFPALLLFALAACEEHDFYGEHTVQYDMDFIAQVGHTYRTEKNSFQVVRVDDGRCRKGDFCCTGANATVQLSFFRNPPLDSSVSLIKPTLYIDSLYFQLKGISPEAPSFDKRIDQKDFRIEMKVSRLSGL
jgi:hypothetical protein